MLLPSDNKIEVLGGARDTIPGNRPVYQLVLTYNLTLSKSLEVSIHTYFLFMFSRM